MKLYLDPSALVKRYVAESDSRLVREAMARAEGWYICRPGFVETVRAVGRAAGERAAKAVKEEWPAFGVVEVDQRLVEHAAALALAHELRSLDALHLAAALVLPGEDIVFATWDKRLHAAALDEGLELLPQVPRAQRAQRRTSERLLAELTEVSELAGELEVRSPAEDFDVGLTTDDMR